MQFEKIEKDTAFFFLNYISDFLDDILNLDHLAYIVAMNHQVIWLNHARIPCFWK